MNKERAVALYQEGQIHQLHGKIDEAIRLYTRSIEAFPTAEAYTFRGWAMSFLRHYDQAIDECKKAIEVDPEFGNPYNDIGTYLVAQGKEDEAVEWFEKAKKAPRYDNRHYPFMNLGRYYADRGMLKRAIQEFEQAEKLCPGDPVCVSALASLRSHLH